MCASGLRPLPGGGDAQSAQGVKMELALLMSAVQSGSARSGFMGIREKKTQTPEILSGWKSIARHLGMGVRTVQRYERQMGLPIRRPAGKLRGAVLATKSELDAWVAASPIRESFQLAKQVSEAPTQDVIALKNRIEQMGVLRDQMAALRNELRESMRSLRNSIENMRGDLRPGRWEIPSLSVLDNNPQTRRLLQWMSMEDKDRKAS